MSARKTNTDNIDMSYDSATRYAQIRSEWNGDDWWMLEEAAFAKQPRARMEILAMMPRTLWKKIPKRGNGNFFTGVLLFAHVIVEFTFPFLYFALTAGWVFKLIPDAIAGLTPVPAQVGIAGGIASLVFLFSSMSLVRLLRRPKDEQRADLTGNGSSLTMSLNLFSATVAAIIAMVAVLAGLSEGAWGLLPLVANLALACVWWRLHRKALKAEAVQYVREPVVPGRKQLNRLKEATKTAISADLSEAFRILEQKGLIDPTLAAKAAHLPLGHLGATLGTSKD